MGDERLTRRWQSAHSPLVAVLGIHVAAAIARMTAVALKGGAVVDELTSWDSEWYLHIAENGYAPRAGYLESPLGFFPLFPGIIRVVDLLLPLDLRWCGLVAGNLGGVLASLALFLLVRDLYDERVALWAVVLFQLQPMGISLSMAYTEGWFAAFAFGALVLLRRGEWLLGGALGALAGLTRITGLAVGGAFVVAAAIALYRRQPAPRGQVVLGTVLSCAGAPLYVLWVGRREGHLGAYQELQTAGWGATWDWGRSSVDFVREALRSGTDFLPVAVALLVLAVWVCSVLAIADLRWVPAWVYGLAVLALSFGQSNSFQGRPRYVVPALIFLIPLAVALSRAERVKAFASLALYGLIGCFFGAYMLVTWPYAI